MANKRLKKITQEERAAKRALRAMGISDYELNRLYDANYKAKARARVFNSPAAEGEQLLLTWSGILKGAKRAASQGVTPNEYIAVRKRRYEASFVLSEAKKAQTKAVIAGSKWLKLCLQRYSTAEIEAAKVEVATDEVMTDGSSYESRRYARARELYARSEGGRAAWDRCLKQSTDEIVDEVIGTIQLTDDFLYNAFGIEAEEVRVRERAYNEAKAQGVKDVRTVGVMGFTETMRNYGGDKWQF